MKLYEFEGKRLLKTTGIRVPRGEVVTSQNEGKTLLSRYGSIVVKAQILWGRRGRAGGIVSCDTEEALDEAIGSLLGRELLGTPVEVLLIEEQLPIERESYLSLMYQKGKPTVIACSEGGMDVEDMGREHPEKLVVQPVHIAKGLDIRMAEDILHRAGFGEDSAPVGDVLLKLYRFFIENDALLAEINPLIKTPGGIWYAADAKIEIDDEALYRLGHLSLPERLSSGRKPTRLEILASKNDLIDTRGAAGRMFYEIPDGDILILAAGGGTSIEALDDLCLLGGRPAVFTEHSGNPTGEKVKGLMKIALMYPGEIHGIWVIGGRANFTDIYETLVNGVLAGIRETERFDRRIPIIVRRAGPRDKEAFEALRKAREEEGYNIFLRGMATSVADSARMVLHQAEKYTERRRGEER